MKPSSVEPAQEHERDPSDGVSGRGPGSAIARLRRAVAQVDLARLGRSARRERGVLIALAVAAAGIWLFAELADDVLEGDTRAFDRTLLLALRDPGDPADALGPAWIGEMMRDVTALGSSLVLTFLTLASAGYLWLQGRGRAALLLLAAILGGFALSHGLKIGFDRPRPDLVAHGARVYTASFPSGHAMQSAITYLTLGALLARMQPKQRLKLYIIALASLLTAAVGFSRVYLGVHWPTDVLAGWAVGSAWALLCWSIALWLQRRGQIRPDVEVSPERA